MSRDGSTAIADINYSVVSDSLTTATTNTLQNAAQLYLSTRSKSEADRILARKQDVLCHVGHAHARGTTMPAARRPSSAEVKE